MKTLAHTLAELQVKKPADKLCDVKVFALVDMLAYILAEKKKRHLFKKKGIVQDAALQASRSKGQES